MFSIIVKKLSTKLLVVSEILTVGASSSVSKLLNGADCKEFMFQVMRISGVGAPNIKVVANTASDGSGDSCVIFEKILPDNPDAPGDYVIVEALRNQVMQMATEDEKKYQYMGIEITGTENDVFAVVSIGGDCRHNFDGLTADYISA
jgi:hypothetical protein